MVAKTVNCIGLRSNHAWKRSPLIRVGEIRAKVGASANSSSILGTADIVLYTLYTKIMIPNTYNDPPIARIAYIGMIAVTVSRKFPYFKVPSGLNCFH